VSELGPYELMTDLEKRQYLRDLHTPKERTFTQRDLDLAVLEAIRPYREALTIHALQYVINGFDRNQDYWRCKICDHNTPISEAQKKADARHEESCILANLQKQKADLSKK
jgi:hypothetical protein